MRRDEAAVACSGRDGRPPDAAILQQRRDSVAAFAAVTAASGSLLQSWIERREVVEYEHFPPDDVVDFRSGSQFYYHAHLDGDHEHGRLHLFWHATDADQQPHALAFVHDTGRL